MTIYPGINFRDRGEERASTELGGILSLCSKDYTAPYVIGFPVAQDRAGMGSLDVGFGAW